MYLVQVHYAIKRSIFTYERECASSMEVENVVGAIIATYFATVFVQPIANGAHKALVQFLNNSKIDSNRPTRLKPGQTFSCDLRNLLPFYVEKKTRKWENLPSLLIVITNMGEDN